MFLNSKIHLLNFSLIFFRIFFQFKHYLQRRKIFLIFCIKKTCSFGIFFEFFLLLCFFWNDPNRQNCRKSSVEECILDYMALHIECRFNKNALLQCYFLAILPAGIYETKSGDNIIA